MKRLITRPIGLLLVVALTVIAVASPTYAARAVSTTAGTGAMAVSSSPCSFIPAQTCQSTDGTVELNIDYNGNTSDCTFVWGVEWGDGGTSANLVVTDPPDGYVLLAQHTYVTPGTYSITVLAGVPTGSCTENDFAVQFTLLPPPISSAHGEACVFNAPKGGFTIKFDGLHISGHVGWAYLADPSTGTWEFGANEGPRDGIYLFPSLTWLAQGNWAEVKSVFKNALHGYHPGNYYLTYRCTSVATIRPEAALKVARTQNDESYRIPGADCLSQTVEVLAAYGAHISEYAYLLDPAYWVPNRYYNSGYMSHFGPKNYL